MTTPSAEVGTRVTHRRYVPYSHAHYAGNLVDGAYSLGLFGDVATELCIVTDGDEGLFRAGTRSRVIHVTANVVARGAATEDRPGAATVLDPPVLATEATGTVVVPGPAA